MSVEDSEKSISLEEKIAQFSPERRELYDRIVSILKEAKIVDVGGRIAYMLQESNHDLLSKFLGKNNISDGKLVDLWEALGKPNPNSGISKPDTAMLAASIVTYGDAGWRSNKH